MFFDNKGKVLVPTLDHDPLKELKLEVDGSNKNAFYAAGDNIEHFEINEYGYIRSDIARIKAQQDSEAAENLLRQLQVFEPSNPNAGKSDAEILLSHRSKYCQTPSEMTRYIEADLARRDAEVLANAPDTDSQEKIQFDKSDDVIDKV